MILSGIFHKLPENPRFSADFLGFHLLQKMQIATRIYIALGILFCCVSCTGAAERRTQWLLRDGDQVWCATPAGSARFNLTTQVWESIVIPKVVEKEPINEIVADGNLIWFYTAHSVVQSNSSRTQWMAYHPEDGIPPGRPSGLAFEEDYVYLAAATGPARFDRTIEEWEILLNDSAKFGSSAHTARLGDYLWFTSRQGMLRYDPSVRAWQNFATKDGLLQNSHYWLYERSDELWAIGDSGVDIYQVEGRNWLRFAPSIDHQFPEIQDIEPDGDILWVLTEKGVRWWNWQERSDRPFPKEIRLQGKTITDVDVEGSWVIFAAEDSVIVLNRENGDEVWTYLDQSRGIPKASFQRVEMVNDLLFLEASNRIVVYSMDAEEVVAEYPFEQRAEAATGCSRFGARVSDQGLEIRGWDHPLFSLQGTSTLFGLRMPEQDWEWWQRTSMSAIHSFPGNRNMTLFYDNTDQERIRWGGVYRGARNDNLRYAEGGNRVPVDLGDSRLLGATGAKGGAVRLEAGSRSEIRGWRQVALSGWGGIQREANADAVFPGHGDVVYYLEHQNLVIGSARVWVDGNELSPDDFVLDNSSGTLSFLFPGRDLVDENSLIEIRYRYNLDEGTGAKFGATQLELAGGDHIRSGVQAMQTEDGTRTGELSAETYIPVPNGEIHLSPEVAMQLDSSDLQSRAGFVEAAGRIGMVKVEGLWIGLDTTFHSFAVENSEFGALRERGQSEILWEPRAWLEIGGQVSRELAKRGREDEWCGSASVSPPGYPSVFASLRRTDAWADTTIRHRDFLNGGIRTQLGNRWINKVGLTQVDLDLRTGWTGVWWTDPRDINPEEDNRTAQVWFRGRLGSGSRISLQPEYFWRRKESRVDLQPPSGWHPEEKRNRLRTSMYLTDLPMGLFTTVRIEGDLQQQEFLAGTDSWDAYFIRTGEVSTEAVPGTWWKLLNPFSLGLSGTVDRRDSLLGLPDHADWIRVFEAADTSTWNQQTLSGCGEITYRPDPCWLMTQVLSITDTKQVQVVHQSNSSVEWSPRGTGRWIFQYQWTKQDFRNIAGSDQVIHRPSVEWHQKWGGPWSSKSTLTGQIYDRQSGGNREASLISYLSVIPTGQDLPKWGNMEFRDEITVSIRKYDTGGRTTHEVDNSLRGDWMPIRQWFFRGEWRVSSSWEDGSRNISHRVDVRTGVRF